MKPAIHPRQKNAYKGKGILLPVILIFFAQFSYAQLNYSSLFTSANFSKTIDLSRPVGTVAGEAGVTPSGGSSYTIPIYAPPGTNGIQPSISMNYNSQSGGGVAGYGWNIAGLSMITRTGKNLYHNDEVKPVEYNWNDAYLLDGTRLNPIVGNNSANGTVYATESETFSKIFSWSGGGTLANPDWFEVIGKDGSVVEYGNTADSRVLGEDGYSVMMWRLNRITDINGNYIEFKYDNTARDSRIDEINYTGNVAAGLAPYTTIKFSYGVRNETNIVYEAGASANIIYTINNITITQLDDNGNPQIGFIKKYQFNYGFDNMYTLLKEVVESGTDNGVAVSLNSTIFLYGDQPANTSVAPTPFIASNNSYYPGDFDADGKTDLLEVESYFDNQINMRLDTKFTLYKDCQGSSGTMMYMKTLPQGTSLDLDNKNFYNFLTGDYNKDGRDDILEANIAFSTPYQRRYLNNIYINFTGSHNPSTGSYDHTVQTYPVAQSDYVYIHSSGNFFIPGDFDGDGNQDFITILAKWVSGYQYDYKAWVSFPAKNELNQPITGFGASIPAFPSNTNERVAEAELITPMDMDGDGKMEIMVTHGGASYFYSLEKTTAFPGFPYWTQIYYNSTTEVVSTSKVYPGDFNGDRKTDLLVRNANGTWKTLISTGKTFVNYTFYFNQTVVMGGSVNHKILVSDYNGDGKSDILHGISTGSGSSSSLSVYYSQAINTWLNEVYTYNNPIPSVQYVVVNSFTNGDFNGDGRTDLVNVVGPAYGADIIYFKPNGKEHLLSKVTDGHNTTTSFNYKLLTDKSTFPYVYNRTVSLDDPSNQNPYNYVQIPMYVVSSMTVPDGIGGTGTTSYSYEDAIIHRYAKGFLGFKKVTAINTILGITSISENAINTQFAVPYNIKQTDKLTSTGQLLKESIVTNNFINLSTGANDIRFVNQMDKVLNIDYLSGIASERLSTYDSYGNITVGVAKTGFLSGTVIVPAQTSTTTTVYGIHNTPIPSRPETITVTNLRAGMPALSTTTDITYTTNGLPLTRIAFSGLPKAVTSTYTYNTYGNAINTVTAGLGVSNRSVNFYFDIRGRFSIMKTLVVNGFLRKELFTYDNKWGAMLSNISPGCVLKTFEYDPFGRLSKTNLPSGYSINTSLVWDIQGEQVFYKLVDFPAGKPDTKLWVDKFQREIKVQTKGFNNQWLTRLITYNNKGNVATKTNDYYPGEPPVVTTTLYDQFSRPLTVSNPTNTLTHTYTQLSGGMNQITIQNSAGQGNTKVFDAAGKTVSTVDNGGQLDFTYDSEGNELETKHGTTVMVTNIYDVYGKRVNVTDKDAGTITYAYDSYGQLTQQTDNSGHTYNMVYDEMGRIISRQGPEGATNYSYVSSTSWSRCNNDEVKEITGFNGVIKEHIYDNLSRLQAEKITVDGNLYTTSYTYDLYDNLISTTYPSGIVVTNGYDANGNLVTITGGDPWNQVTLFTANAENGHGQLTSYTLGNGQTSQNTYQYGVPVRLYTPGIQDLNLTFDYTKGNLLSRYEVTKNLTETFQYDNLNRLTTTAVNGVQQLGINYDGNTNFSMGNIISKTDAGNYVYRNDKIHAVAYITNPAGPTAPPITISPALQQIAYTPFLKAASITEGSVHTNFTYGPNYERIKSEMLVSGSIHTTKYFMGNFERIINGGLSRDIHYIPVGNSIAVIEKYLWSSSIIHFVYTDYLGSLLTRTDINGTITAEQNFDAWGRQRNPNNWQYAGTGISPAFFDRGFTGHEELPYFSLINMNGRIYDPIQGRMLSPDNYVPDSRHTQGYNRYSYANNNPLVYTDPDGNFIHLIVGAIIGGVVNLFSSAMAGNIHSFWDGLKAFGIGAASGAIMAGIGNGGFGWKGFWNAFNKGFFSNAVSNMLVGMGSSFIPPIPFGNNFSISPSFAFGSHGLTAGLTASLHIGNFSLGVGFNNAPGNASFSYGAGFDNGNFGLSYSHTKFSGSLSQATATYGFRFGRVSGKWENDLFAKGNYDRWRTNGMGLSYAFNSGSSFSVGSRFMTGEDDGTPGIRYPNGYTENSSTLMRQGLFYAQYTNANGLSVSAGVDSELERYKVMKFIHSRTHDGVFENLGARYPLGGFTRYGNNNPFTFFW